MQEVDGGQVSGNTQERSEVLGKVASNSNNCRWLRLAGWMSVRLDLQAWLMSFASVGAVRWGRNSSEVWDWAIGSGVVMVAEGTERISRLLKIRWCCVRDSSKVGGRQGAKCRTRMSIPRV